MDGGEYSGIGVGHEAAEADVIQYVLGPAPGVDGVVVDRSAWYVLLIACKKVSVLVAQETR